MEYQIWNYHEKAIKIYETINYFNSKMLRYQERITDHEPMLCPVVIKSCHCEQCQYVKNKRKNRKFKKKIKRWLNKKRRNDKYDGKCLNHYWA